MARTVIRGGQRVTASGIQTGDIAFEKGIITDVAGYIDLKGDDILINAQGYYVLPGLIDGLTFIEFNDGQHTTIDTWEQSSHAAAAGGITTQVTTVQCDKNQTWEDAVNARQALARDAVTDYTFHGLVTAYPAKKFTSLEKLIEQSIHSVLVHLAGPESLYLNDAELLRLLRRCAELNLLVLVYAESHVLVADSRGQLQANKEETLKHFPDSHPVEAEWEAINRVLFLADLAGAAICLVAGTTQRSIEMAQQARSQSTMVLCASQPAYLLLDDAAYTGTEPEKYVLAPPLRSVEQQEALWQFLKTPIMSLLVSHSLEHSLRSRTEAQRLEDVPAGLPTSELMLPLLYSEGVLRNRIGLPELVHLMCEAPARLFGLSNRKGQLEEGYDADIVLFDPEEIWTVSLKNLHHASDYNPFEGRRVQGQVATTLSRGEVIFQNGEVVGRRGHGQFVARQPVNIRELL